MFQIILFFKTGVQWYLRGSLCSYSFPVRTEPTFEYDERTNSWLLSIRSSIKNNDGTLEKFLDWIKPYIESGSGPRDLYATVHYEEFDTPTSYYLIEKDKIDEKESKMEDQEYRGYF